MASHSSPHYSGNPSALFIKNNQGKMIIPPKDLSIVWGNDNRYWNIPQKENMAVELYQVSWLEVNGSVNGTRPEKSYEVGFRVSFNPDAFGWGKYPIFIMVKRGKKGKVAWTKISMDEKVGDMFEIRGKSEVVQNEDSNDTRLYFGLYEVWSGKWKGGLKIHHAFITELP